MKGQIIFEHGDLYKEIEVPVYCPECGSDEVTVSKRKETERGNVFNKKYALTVYTCKGCNCEFGAKKLTGFVFCPKKWVVVLFKILLFVFNVAIIAIGGILVGCGSDIVDAIGAIMIILGLVFIAALFASLDLD